MTSIYSTIKQNFSKKYKIVLILFFMILIELFDKTSIIQTSNNLRDECMEMQNTYDQNRTRTSDTPITTLPKVKINYRARKKIVARRRQCTFYDPLINKSNAIFCATQNFVSLVRSKCKTRLGEPKISFYSKIMITFIGNQLSSYAATRYFQAEFGMHPILDPFQTSVISSGDSDTSHIMILNVLI